MANVPGRWQREPSTWRKISLNTWSTPDNATIYGLMAKELKARLERPELLDERVRPPLSETIEETIGPGRCM